MSPPPSDANSQPPPPFTPQDALDFLQKMWNPFGVPMPGFAPGAGAQTAPGSGAGTAGTPGGMAFPHPAAMFSAIDPHEVQRKIEELRVIESWLQMSLNIMQMSIKTMELQKASLEAIRGATAAEGGGGDDHKAGGARRK